MKINTISAYVLVYLLARGHWNLMVPVRADVEADGSSASASADAGSASTDGSVSVPSGGAAEGSSLAAPAAPEGSSASADAGSTPADGSGQVSVGSDADADQANAASSVELGSLYPDFFTGGTSADEAPMTNPVLVAKREDAKRLADDARNAAQELLKKADELELAIKDTGVLEDFSAKVDSIAYNLSVEASRLKSAAKPTDMMYYSGFPDGHHRYDAGADDLIEREIKWHKGSTYYSGFPDGHHRYDAGADDLIERELKWHNGMLYHNGFPDGWHFGDPETLKEVRKYDIKVEAAAVRTKIEAKKEEIDRLKIQIDQLTLQYNSLDDEVKRLEAEHKELELKLLGLDASLIKLYKADDVGNPVEMVLDVDFTKKRAHGDLRFEFKDGVKCTMVTFGVHELWKKGDHAVDEPKIVAFNDSMGLLAVRDDAKAVLYKKETTSDKWNHHNTIERKRAAGTSRTPAQTGSSAAPAPGSLTSGLSESKMSLDTASTGTPETPESLDETASVASGGSETNEANESESSSALRGSTVGSADGGSSSGGEAATEYSSVFMD